MSTNSLAVTLSRPLSLYSIPLVWFTALYPCALKVLLINKYAGFNNVAPRGNVNKMKSKNIVPYEFAEKAARLEASHFNGNEILPMWVAAVLAGNYAKLSHKTLNLFSIAFIVSRILYNYIYANQTTREQSLTRSATWWISIGLPLAIITKAANKLRLAQ